MNIRQINDAFAALEIAKPIPLNKLYDSGTFKSNPNTIEMPQEGCIYAFWWIGNKGRMPEFVRKTYSVRGPNGKDVKISPESHYDATKQRTCLYVGKTHKPLKERIRLHLRLGTTKEYNSAKDAYEGNRISKSTTNQLRRGYDRLYWNTGKDLREDMINNIGISFVAMPGETEAANRFYVENKAIGIFLPVLNVDVER